MTALPAGVRRCGAWVRRHFATGPEGRPQLTLATLIVVLASSPLFLRTLINDDSTYALIGRKLARGFNLYVDAVDNKPPFIYWTFAATFLLANTVAVAKVLSIVANMATVHLVFRFTKNHFTGRTAGIASLLVACALVTGVAEDSIAPNTETFSNVFAILALVLVSEGLGAGRGRIQLILAGASVAAAILYRLQAATILLPIVLLPWSRHQRLGGSRWLFMGAGFAVVFGATLAYLHATGAAEAAWFWVMTQNQAYLRSGLGDGWTLSKFGRIGIAVLTFLPLIVCLLVVTTRLARARWPGFRSALPLAAGLVAGLLTYGLGLRFYGHYLLPALPFAGVLAAWGMGETGTSVRLVAIFTRLSVIWAAGFAAYNFAHLSESPDHRFLSQVAHHLRNETASGDQVLAWGAPAQVIFESDRDFATRFPSNNQLTGQIFGTRLVRADASRADAAAFEDPGAWRLLLEDLTASPPAAIVDGAFSDFRIDSYEKLASFVKTSYGPPITFRKMRIYLRRGDR